MHWFSSLLNTLNYWTIFFGMYIEGTVIPFPSELIVSPAAYHAAAGHLNIVWVIIIVHFRCCLQVLLQTMLLLII